MMCDTARERQCSLDAQLPRKQQAISTLRGDRIEVGAQAPLRTQAELEEDSARKAYPISPSSSWHSAAEDVRAGPRHFMAVHGLLAGWLAVLPSFMGASSTINKQSQASEGSIWDSAQNLRRWPLMLR